MLHDGDAGGVARTGSRACSSSIVASSRRNRLSSAGSTFVIASSLLDFRGYIVTLEDIACRFFACSQSAVSPWLWLPRQRPSRGRNRPIRLIVPTGPGAATDVMARLLGDHVSRSLGQPMVVENMAGASGILAHQSARAPADGYTLLFTNTSGMAINLISFKQLPYDPMRDFTPVAMVCSLGPQMLSVNAELPIKTSPNARLRQDESRQALDGVRYDCGAAALPQSCSTPRRARPDRSALSISRADGAGHRKRRQSGDAQFDRRGPTSREAGKVRRIAITSEKRFPGLPDLPSVSETVPGVVMNGWFAFVAPAGTPSTWLRGSIASRRYLDGPDIQQRLLALGLATEGAGTPASAAQHIRDEQETWRGLAKELQIEPQ